jgi:hypothetical protein
VNDSHSDSSSESQSPEVPSGLPPESESAAGHPSALPGEVYHFRWLDLLFVTVFYVVVGGAFTLLAVAVASAMLHIPPNALEKFPVVYAAVAAITQVLLYLALLGFLWLLVRSRGTMPFWTALGWRAFPPAVPRAAMIARYLLLGVALLVGVQIAGSFLHMPSGVPLEKMFRNPESVLITMALAVLVAPLMEETLFRGCMYPVVARSFGMPTGVIVTGLAFGLMHGLQLDFAWQPIVLLSGVGMALTYVRARAGTVLASFLVHLSYNASLFGAFYVATNGLRNFPGS